MDFDCASVDEHCLTVFLCINKHLASEFASHWAEAVGALNHCLECFFRISHPTIGSTFELGVDYGVDVGRVSNHASVGQCIAFGQGGCRDVEDAHGVVGSDGVEVNHITCCGSEARNDNRIFLWPRLWVVPVLEVFVTCSGEHAHESQEEI